MTAMPGFQRRISQQQVMDAFLNQHSVTVLQEQHVYLICTCNVTHFQCPIIRNVSVQSTKHMHVAFICTCKLSNKSITVPPSMARVQVHISECQRWIRQLWPSTTGSSVEAHVRIHSNTLACSSQSEPIPHHPFCSTTISWTCEGHSAEFVQLQGSRGTIPAFYVQSLFEQAMLQESQPSVLLWIIAETGRETRWICG